MRQAGLRLLPADHDGPAHGDAPGHCERVWQAGRLGCPGACPAQPEPGFWRDGAGDSPGQDAAGQDVGDRPVQPQRDPLPGQRQPCADHVIPEADVARGVHGPLDLDLDLDHVTGGRRKRRRTGGAGSGRSQAGQIAGI